MNYYDRTSLTYLDGTKIFKSEDDEKSEFEVAALLEKFWSCQMHSFGKLALIDWYAERAGRVIGVVELKTRSHAHDHYPTVFLNVRKWLALMMASIGLGVPGIFVVRFTDKVMWISIANIESDGVSIRGCKKIVKSRNDIEPVFDVPIAQMSDLIPLKEKGNE
jgi:hypothetical protein